MTETRARETGGVDARRHGRARRARQGGRVDRVTRRDDAGSTDAGQERRRDEESRALQASLVSTVLPAAADTQLSLLRLRSERPPFEGNELVAERAGLGRVFRPRGNRIGAHAA